MIDRIIEALVGLPAALIYIVIGAGAAIENVVPPIPADTFVLLGAFLAAAGSAEIWLVFLVTWTANVATACLVYTLAWRWGEGFFDTRTGRFLLHPHQLRQIAGFYRRWGAPAIFVSRFLPAFRAVVPVFAGVTRVRFWSVFPPLAIASAAWYGALVYLGGFAHRNWDAIVALFSSISAVLGIIAGMLLAVVAWWWWRGRRGQRR